MSARCNTKRELVLVVRLRLALAPRELETAPLVTSGGSSAFGRISHHPQRPRSYQFDRRIELAHSSTRRAPS